MSMKTSVTIRILVSGTSLHPIFFTLITFIKVYVFRVLQLSKFPNPVQYLFQISFPVAKIIKIPHLTQPIGDPLHALQVVNFSVILPAMSQAPSKFSTTLSK